MSAREEIAKALAISQTYYPELLDGYRDEVLREAAEKIRASTQDARKVERDRFKFTDFESQLQYEAAMAAADLIDPDKED